MNAGDAQAMYVRMRTLVAGYQPLTGEVRAWFLEGAEQYEKGVPFEHALGLNVESGQAWRHPVRQLRRAGLEGLILLAADLAGARDNRVAHEISRELSEYPDRPARLPGISKDFLSRMRRLYPGEYPCSRSAIYKLLNGDSQAIRDGVVRSCKAIQTSAPPWHAPDYGNTAHTLAVRRYR